ncbi:MAG: hypothetical protein L6R40_005848 [Gallowayella cf. fulva]|nr:MAG: hypothetical protein L6R40_005848 [Xanthomendoza cf. fulva]
MHLLSGILPLLTTFALPILGIPIDGTKPAKPDPNVLQHPNPHAKSPVVLSLTRKLNPPPQRSRYARVLERAYPVNGTVGTSVINAFGEITYMTNITFGTQTIQAVVDTGSSDTWAVQTGFKCVQGRRASEITVPEAQCGFGTTVTTSPTFRQIANQSLSLSYNDGEELSGVVGTEDVTLGGITVKGQEVGLVNHAYWFGDNSSSGLIGLAFPALTSAFDDNNPIFTPKTDSIPYNPLFTNMYTKGLVAPVFSIAINRRGEETGGLLALGGLPPVNHSSTFACTPIKTTSTRHSGSGINGTTIDPPQYKYYAITVDGLKSGTPFDNDSFDAHVDSGTSLLSIPEEAATAVNKLFDPPALINYSTGLYQVSCTAKAADFGIKIGGQTFHINPQDLIIHSAQGSCFSGITASYSGLAVLGDVFLKNVVAVFDVGHHEMSFAAREFY